MKKNRLTKILVEGDPKLLQKLCEQVEELGIVYMERAPKTGLVMIKTRDSVSMQPFYMGEVLVTECTVSVAGKLGMGVIMGEELERAYQIAVVDAAFNAKLPIIEDWLLSLEAEEEQIKKRQVQESLLAAQSQVHFDTMEDYNAKS